MKDKIIWKLLSAFACVSLISIFVMNFFVGLRLQDYYEDKIIEELKSNSFLVGDIIQKCIERKDSSDVQTEVKRLAVRLHYRVTVLDNNGAVLGDSRVRPGNMDNHKERPEIVGALNNGYGDSTRYSSTVGMRMKYVATAIKNKNQIVGIVRLAVPLADIEIQKKLIYRVVLFGGVIALICALIIGYYASRSVTRPIYEMKEKAENFAKGDFTKKIKITSKDELGQLAQSLNSMAVELQIKMDNLRKMDKVRTDFVANVSHELKTPLTSIRGFVETLEDGALDDKENAKRFLSIINKHTIRLDAIVNDLLTLTELELERDRIERTHFDLKELIEEVLLGFGHALNKQHISLETNYTGSDFTISADKDRIEQIIVNIIDNAVKYSEPGGIIKISLEKEKDALKIKITDSGIGIPQEELTRVFERFYRVDKARSSERGGTGLGLSIVKHIVSLHNGQVHIDSEPGKGTSVTVILSC
ncbi:MAG: ATP-binding protein [Candidatus Ancaeobacter aquaticus]|nr:ATP-binding protein [Candidatus Ancaeobacter aquaticus]